jgi:hypothetical protein
MQSGIDLAKGLFTDPTVQGLGLGIGGTALVKDAYDRLQDIGEESLAGTTFKDPVTGETVRIPGAVGLAQEAVDMSQFRPFTVTTATGGTFGATPTIDPETGMVTGLGTTMGLSPAEQQLQRELMAQAQSRLATGTVGAPSSQTGGLRLMGAGRTMFEQDPFGLAQQQAAATQAFGAGGEFMTAAGAQPADINLLRGQFAGQVGGLLSQQPSAAIGQFGQQALSMGAAGLGGAGIPDVSGAFTGITAPGLRDVSQAYSGIQAPGVRTAAGQLAARGLGLGMAGLETQAPSDVEALRQQYTQLASQTAGRALQDTAGREADVYERIRATQRPEEERQRLALEERMAQQGRLGVRTAMYGGTPEQAALAMQQEEAQNRASLAAIQQAQAERQQAVSEAQTFGGLFGQQAGLSSQLQSAAQQRATQLSQLGLSAEQTQAQLEQEGFGRQMQLGQAGMQAQQAQAQLEAQRLGQQLQLGQAGIGAAQAQSALQTQAQQRAAQLSQLGLSAQQIESQLQSEGLSRAATAAGQAGQMAQLAGGLQAQQAGLGATYAGLGSQLAAQQQALDAAQQAQAIQSLVAGQGLLSGGLGLEQAQQQLTMGALGGAYLPQAQLLNAMQATQMYPQLQQQAQLFGTGQFGETMMSGLEARLIAEQKAAGLLGGLGTGLLGALLS